MSTANKRILLIDDDPDMHEAIKMILEPVGYAVTCCLTGSCGLEKMRNSPPDLVLLDIMLSSPLEGFQVAYEIRQEPAWASIPIVLISAIGRSLGKGFAREYGSEYVPPEAFLDKPLEARTLRETVDQLLADKE